VNRLDQVTIAHRSRPFTEAVAGKELLTPPFDQPRATSRTTPPVTHCWNRGEPQPVFSRFPRRTLDTG
jgi:hypothetical protein